MLTAFDTHLTIFSVKK